MWLFPWLLKIFTLQGKSFLDVKLATPSLIWWVHPPGTSWSPPNPSDKSLQRQPNCQWLFILKVKLSMMPIIFLVSFNPAYFPQISWVSLPTNSDLLFIITSYLFSSLLIFCKKWNLVLGGYNYMKHYAHHSFEISFHLPSWNQWNMSAWTLWLWEHSIAFSLQKWQYCSVQMNTYFNFRNWKWIYYFG